MGSGAVKIFCQSREKSLRSAHSVTKCATKECSSCSGAAATFTEQYRRPAAQPSRNAWIQAHTAIPTLEDGRFQAKGRHQPSARMEP